MICDVDGCANKACGTVRLAQDRIKIARLCGPHLLSWTRRWPGTGWEAINGAVPAGLWGLLPRPETLPDVATHQGTCELRGCARDAAPGMELCRRCAGFLDAMGLLGRLTPRMDREGNQVGRAPGPLRSPSMLSFPRLEVQPAYFQGDLLCLLGHYGDLARARGVALLVPGDQPGTAYLPFQRDPSGPALDPDALLFSLRMYPKRSRRLEMAAAIQTYAALIRRRS